MTLRAFVARELLGDTEKSGMSSSPTITKVGAETVALEAIVWTY
jgi:hypothetical protein